MTPLQRKIRKLHLAGCTPSEIQSRLGVSLEDISLFLHNNSLKVRHVAPDGYIPLISALKKAGLDPYSKKLLAKLPYVYARGRRYIKWDDVLEYLRHTDATERAADLSRRALEAAKRDQTTHDRQSPVWPE
jgi:hypothetical protein